MPSGVYERGIEQRKKISLNNSRRGISEETKRKISDSMKIYHNPENYRKEWNEENKEYEIKIIK